MKVYLLPILFLFLSCTQSKNEQKNNINTGNLNGLYVVDYRYNFGEVYSIKKDTINFSFTLENKGDTTLIIRHVSPSCNCIKITYQPHLIKSKEKAIVKGYISTKNRIGKFSKPVFVSYNKNEVLLLRIIGNIK